MESFTKYVKSDMSNDCFGPYDDTEDRLLLDMDSMVARKEDVLASRIYESPLKKCLLGEEAEDADGSGWSEKPVEKWCLEESINWLVAASSHLGQPYGSIQQRFAASGKDLLALNRHDFVNYDPIYGEKLYDLLHCHKSSVTKSTYDWNFSQSKVAVNASDVESDNSTELARKRPPGRPRLLKAKRNSTSQGKLWEFIRDLLMNKKTCPSLICWEDYSQAKFRFVRSDEVAKLWGSRKGNMKMTYEKLSRAMRYYYKRKIFLPVLGRRLVYQFGPNATGWQTDNPNFRY